MWSPKAPPSSQPGAAPQGTGAWENTSAESAIHSGVFGPRHFGEGYVFDVRANRCLELRFLRSFTM